MYLSRISISLGGKGATRMISDVYSLHQFVWSGFSGCSPMPRILFRLEPGIKDEAVEILVQSDVEPFWPQANNGNSQSVRAVTNRFKPIYRNGALCHYSLRANPTVCRNGKRYALDGDNDLKEWLTKKQDSAGVLFQSMAVMDDGFIAGKRIKNGSCDTISLKMVRYEGVLTVMDSCKLTSAVADGIGPAKGFGCGLLSLTRI